MGRWLSTLRDEEKNTKTPVERTPKTPKTSQDRVLGVLGVSPVGISEKISQPDGRVRGGFGGFGGSSTGAFTKKFHVPTPAPDPPAASFDSRRAAVARLLDAMALENEARRDWHTRPVDGWKDGRMELRNIVRGDSATIILPKKGN